MSQEDNKRQSSNNASKDLLDDEEVMIKQESNYEGQGDHGAIEEENKDQILNHNQDFLSYKSYPQVLRERHCYLKKILLRLLREIINLEFKKSNYFHKWLEEYLLQQFIDNMISCVIRVRHLEKKDQVLKQ